MDLSYQDKLDILLSIQRKLTKLKEKAATFKNETIEFFNEDGLLDSHNYIFTELGGGLLALLFVIVTLIGFCIWRRRRRRSNTNQG